MIIHCFTRGKILDRSKICRTLRNDREPTIQIVGSNEAIPRLSMASRLLESLSMIWVAVMNVINYLLGNRFLNYVVQMIQATLSTAYLFFSSMFVGHYHPPTEQHQEIEEQIEIVRRINTGGQQRCR